MWKKSLFSYAPSISQQLTNLYLKILLTITSHSWSDSGCLLFPSREFDSTVTILFGDFEFSRTFFRLEVPLVEGIDGSVFCALLEVCCCFCLELVGDDCCSFFELSAGMDGSSFLEHLKVVSNLFRVFWKVESNWWYRYLQKSGIIGNVCETYFKSTSEWLFS